MGLRLRRSSSGALSDRASGKGGAGCLVLFGLVFAGFGSLFVVIFFLLPLMRALNAHGWVEVPCTIIESRVGESSDSDGTTYRVEVRFAYHFQPGALEPDPQAPRYESTRYDFAEGIYTSGYDGKAAEVALLAPGTQTTCRVDPENPAEAVLRPGIPGEVWFGLIPLIFPLVGIAIMIAGFRGMRRQRLESEGRLGISSGLSNRRASGPADGNTSAIDDDGQTGPRELRPAQGRLFKLIFIGIFALFWNGISWAIFLAFVPEALQGELIAWIPVLFISIFLLIGLVMIGAFVHQLLALSNPRLRLTIARWPRPGETLELEWECQGNPSRLTALRLTLEGRESATYTRGTDTVTDSHVFARIELTKTDDPSAMLSGKARVVLPLTTVPTFIASRNKLEWILSVRGTIPRWPDLSDDYPITILPRKSP
jgi:hypothetical protein